MLSHQDIVQYMQDAVTASVDIPESNFFRMDISEIQGAMRTGIENICLILESHEGNFENSKTSNSLDNKTFAFSVLKNPEQNNYAEQNQYLNDCEIIGKKFLARMRYHSAQQNSTLYNAFDVSLCTYHKVGPVFLGWYGYRFEVSLKPSRINLKIDPADWADINTPC